MEVVFPARQNVQHALMALAFNAKEDSSWIQDCVKAALYNVELALITLLAMIVLQALSKKFYRWQTLSVSQFWVTSVSHAVLTAKLAKFNLKDVYHVQMDIGLKDLVVQECSM